MAKDLLTARADFAAFVSALQRMLNGQLNVAQATFLAEAEYAEYEECVEKSREGPGEALYSEYLFYTGQTLCGTRFVDFGFRPLTAI